MVEVTGSPSWRICSSKRKSVLLKCRWVGCELIKLSKNLHEGNPEKPRVAQRDLSVELCETSVNSVYLKNIIFILYLIWH